MTASNGGRGDDGDAWAHTGPNALVAPATAERARLGVVVADEEEHYLEELTRAIEADPALRVIGAATDGQAAFQLIGRTLAHVALLEPSLPGLSALEITRAIEREGLATRVVLLCAGPEPRQPYAAIGAGVRCYLTRRVGGEQIRAAVAAAAAPGGIVVEDRLHTTMFAELAQRGRETDRLDEKTRIILQLMANGLDVDEVAEEMQFSQTTVYSTLRIFCERLEVPVSVGSAVAAAVHGQLIDYPARQRHF
jgi:two-component system nitrate/nitrite response regulator NarL